jgi:pyrroline-5-carboxylate reductase
MSDHKITVVGGGRMGEALCLGIVKTKFAKLENINVIEPLSDRAAFLREEHSLNVSLEYGKYYSEEQIVISIAAGIPISRFLEKFSEKAKIIRVMPNTPCLVGSGASALCSSKDTEEDDISIALELFSSVGIVERVPESLMDAVTGLSGSGPAYVFQFIEALSDAGVRVGLTREQSLKLAAQTVYGSSRLLLETGEHPGKLKDMVTSPGGTTIAGIHALEKGGIRSTVIDAVVAATNRSNELGKK